MFGWRSSVGVALALSLAAAGSPRAESDGASAPLGLALTDWPAAYRAQASCEAPAEAFPRDDPFPLSDAEPEETIRFLLSSADLSEVEEGLDAFAACLDGLETLARRGEASAERDQMLYSPDGEDLVALHLSLGDRVSAFAFSGAVFEANGRLNAALGEGMVMRGREDAFAAAYEAFYPRIEAIDPVQSRLSEARRRLEDGRTAIDRGRRGPPATVWRAMEAHRAAVREAIATARTLIVAPEILAPYLPN